MSQGERLSALLGIIILLLAGVLGAGDANDSGRDEGSNVDTDGRMWSDVSYRFLVTDGAEVDEESGDARGELWLSDRFEFNDDLRWGLCDSEVVDPCEDRPGLPSVSGLMDDEIPDPCIAAVPSDPDLSGDCRVDLDDFSIFADQWGKIGDGIVGDFDGSDEVDVADLAYL